MRDVIFFYEKIKIIKAKAAVSTNSEVKNLLQELNRHLQLFTAEKEFNENTLRQQVQKGEMIVNQLSEKLKN